MRYLKPFLASFVLAFGALASASADAGQAAERCRAVVNRAIGNPLR